MPQFLQETRDGPVVTLTLNDPDRRNALSNQAQWDEVAQACLRIGRDTEVRCLIITGAGSADGASSVAPGAVSGSSRLKIHTLPFE